MQRIKKQVCIILLLGDLEMQTILHAIDHLVLM